MLKSARVQRHKAQTKCLYCIERKTIREEGGEDKGGY